MSIVRSAVRKSCLRLQLRVLPPTIAWGRLSVRRHDRLLRNRELLQLKVQLCYGYVSRAHVPLFRERRRSARRAGCPSESLTRQRTCTVGRRRDWDEPLLWLDAVNSISSPAACNLYGVRVHV